MKKGSSSEGVIGRLITSQCLLKLPKGRNPPDPVEELVIVGAPSTVPSVHYQAKERCSLSKKELMELVSSA